MTTADALAGLDFGEMIRQTRRGCVLKPLLLNFIEQADELEVPGLDKRDLGARPPDGWFHPSTHPLWEERALYEYLAHPGRVPPRHFDYAARMAVTFGSSGHLFFQHVLDKMGLLPRDLQACATCPPAARCQEPSWVDEEAGSRGHGDGVLALPGHAGEDLLEVKFTNENTWGGARRLAKLEDRDDEAFARTWPDYRAQALEYQRLSGRRRTVVLLGVMGYPFELREFHVVYDRHAANGVRDKYLRVRQAVADQRPPRCGCAAKERAGCPGRAGCAA